EYTTLIAQRLARTLGGTCLCWSRAEQKRSELLWCLARIRRGEGGDFSSFLDPRNRDPNYLHTEEVLQNPWFRQMCRLAERWREHNTDGDVRRSLHVDVHGCRDPPITPSHLTIGLAAMRNEVDSGRSSLSLARVEAFGALLKAELSAVLSQLDLRPQFVLVRVLLPALAEGRERLSGAWALEDRRLTQSQQALTYAGFTHSCQLELSKSLRRVLSRDDAANARLGRAILRAWTLSFGTNATLPSLPRSPASCAAEGRDSLLQSGPSSSSAKARVRRSCPPRLRISSAQLSS
ncbi:unnamed protein product, partial [Polarella glacialis]